MEQTVFEIGGVEYNVVKRGVGQAKQVADLGHWLAKYGTPAFRNMSNEGLSTGSTFEVIVALLGQFSSQALIELFIMVFGCSEEVANEHFDVGLLIDGIISLYDNQPTVKKLVNRFFSVAPSTSPEVDSSTPSEQPTDGPTTIS